MAHPELMNAIGRGPANSPAGGPGTSAEPSADGNAPAGGVTPAEAEKRRQAVEGAAPELSGTGVTDEIINDIAGKPITKLTGSPTAGRVANALVGIAPLAMGLKGAIGADLAGAEGAGAAEAAAGAAKPAAGTILDAQGNPIKSASAATSPAEGAAAEAMKPSPSAKAAVPSVSCTPQSIGTVAVTAFV